MEAVLQGLAGIFEVALIAGLGFFLSRKGWFWETAGKDLTRLTMTVGIPAMMIYSMESRFTRDSLLAMAPDLLLPFASIFAAYLLGRVWAALLRIPKGRRGTDLPVKNPEFTRVPVATSVKASFSTSPPSITS